MLWVFDLDGVVWLAGRPIPGSPEAISALRSAGHQLAFVTNNSTPTLSEYADRLVGAGVDARPEELATSSQAAASLLTEGSKVTVVGGEGLREAVTGAGAHIVPANEHPAAVVVGRSLRLDFDELARAATAIREGARFIATNTDATFPTPHGPEPGAGALVAYLEVGAGSKAEVAGKPHGPMAELVRSRFGQPDIVVGDRADTDGRFATNIGAPFGLVLSGVTRKGDLPVDPAPTWIADDLAALVTKVADGRPDRPL